MFRRAILILALSACAEEQPTLVCGGATTRVGNTCVATPEPPTACAAGTHLNATTNQCESDIVCGHGTTYDAATGDCLPNSECGTGTTLDPTTGLCEPDFVCGPDTTWNSQTGECEPSFVCGDNTVLVDGRCVPVSRCGDGTTFDPTTGQCSPDLLCGPGLSDIDGVCLSATQIKEAAADVIEAVLDDNDPAFGGTPEAVALEPIGEETVFVGTIGRAVDIDGDSAVDQDLDVWSFAGSTGQLLRIRVLADGLPQPTFLVTGPNGFVRSSIVGTESEPERRVLLPFDGTYELTIAPAARRLGGAPMGGADYGYVGIIEEVDWPAVTDLVIPSGSDPASIASDTLLDLSGNFFHLLGPAGATALFDATSAGVDTFPILVVLTAAGEPVGEITFAPAADGHAGDLCDGDERFVACDNACVGGDGIFRLGVCTEFSNPDPFDTTFRALNGLYLDANDGLIVVVDWAYSNGGDADFDVSLSNTPTVALGTMLDNDERQFTRRLVPARTGLSVTFDAPAGQMVTTVFNGFANATKTLVGPSGIIEPNTTLTTHAFFARESGRYVWIYVNSGGDTAADARPAAAIFTETPIDAGLAAFDGVTTVTASFTGDDLLPGRWKGDSVWILADLASPGLLRARWRFVSGEPSIEFWYLDPLGRIVDRRSSDEDDYEVLRQLHEAPGQGLLRFYNSLAGITPDPIVPEWLIELEAVAVPAMNGEVEPNDTPATATDIGLVADVARVVGTNENVVDELDHWTFTIDPPLAANEIMDVQIENLDDLSAPRMRIFSGTTRLYPGATASATATITSDYGVAWPMKPGDGTGPFTIEIEATSLDGPERYLIELRREVRAMETEPNQPIASAQNLGALTLPAMWFGEAGGTGTGGDLDFFGFSLAAPLAAGEALRISVQNDFDADDLRPVLYAANRTTVLIAADDYEDVAYIYRPADQGPFYLEVKSDATTATSSPNRERYRVIIDVVPNGEVEPNNAVATATQLGTLDRDGSAAGWGYELLNGSDHWRVDLTSPLAADEVLSFRWAAAEQRGPLQANVLNSAGTLMISTELYNGEVVVQPTGSSGPFYVNIVPRHSTTGTGQTYRVEARRLSGRIGEIEPNNDQGTAQAVTLPVVIRAQSNSPSAAIDADIYSFTLDHDLGPTEHLEITATVPVAPQDVTITVYDSAFQPIATASDFDAFLNTPLPVTTTGTTYYVGFLGSDTTTLRRNVYEATLILAP
jgi:hypothetical protein